MLTLQFLGAAVVGGSWVLRSSGAPGCCGHWGLLGAAVTGGSWVLRSLGAPGCCGRRGLLGAAVVGGSWVLRSSGAGGLAEHTVVLYSGWGVTKLVSHVNDITSCLEQIDFLNSVIVDLQRKNQELTGKLEKMAEAALNGNNASELDNYDGLKDAPSKKKPPPRLFCDICDCFDLHDTEDCPTQAQLPDSPPHTAYHGNRSDERPYCDICEVFGHWTDSCNDDQTF
ncbi:hypothetical protein JZ751_012998 [Albula glossodonta]|uniref:CLIP1 zinc knuckle domain-containing protein n=1 Tax=Albula glossodonta TaxID=121402 RepID=A0A8T2N9P4_9TELE|nr:hypothetical protein JZ751_012998 [Albula glossodonta]